MALQELNIPPESIPQLRKRPKIETILDLPTISSQSSPRVFV